MTTEPIRFFHRGEIVAVDTAAPTRTVLDWLREDAHCTGTKEGCNEGDCGACTVVVGELPDADAAAGSQRRARPGAAQRQRLHPVPADAARQGAVHGRGPAGASRPARPTTRRARNPNVRALHPVQQAMVDCHGSQCGFCTPGFVMSLFGGTSATAPAAAGPRASSWPTSCPATCAAAPATGRSSTPASACSTCRRWASTPRP